jgi:N-methylhydantoinase A/oxoprolinase/acetone carboxylase beta subunit
LRHGRVASEGGAAGHQDGAGVTLRLGIDTGGTFTDAVLLDAADKVVACAKALTTRHDLALGIGEAVRAARAAVPGRIGLVSLSTTLATNALVEGRGGRAGLLLIGLDEAALRRGGLERGLGDSPAMLVGGGHRADGTEQAPLDVMAARAAIAQLEPDVEALAVCGQFAVRNAAHERIAAALARDAGLPVTCSHELTARLDAPRRALTTLLNARLVPEIAALLEAIDRLLAAEDISAPVMVVTGDGSLLGAEAARLRPIETILSGPAASAVGAAHLAGLDDAVVADIGGTTTDVSVLRGGRPRLAATGATVGGHVTMIEAIEVRTAGLGGDSEVRQHEGHLVLGPRRVVPLSLLAMQHEHVLEILAAQLARGRPREHDGRLVLRRRAPGDAQGLGPSLRRAWALLESGPATLEEVIDRQHLGLAARKLIERGLAVGAGFTPSDAAHLLGQQSGWSVEAARLGALLTARLLGPPVAPEELARRVLRLASERTAELLVEAGLAADGEPAEQLHLGMAGRLLGRWLHGRDGTVRPCFALTLPIVALGGPAPVFCPRPAELLGTRLVVPPHHAIGNAVGAAVGQVERRAAITITAAGESAWRVHLPEGSLDFPDIAAALALAEARATDAARRAAEGAGARQLAVSIERREVSYPDATGAVRTLEVELTATAVGRPPLASAPA